MERAFSSHGSPSSGYSPTWLCAKDPKQEFKRESFELFGELLDSLKFDVISTLSRVRVQQREEVDRMEEQRRIQAEEAARNQQLQHESADGLDDSEESASNQPSVREERKVGRNEPCPCGSGKNTNNATVKFNRSD